MIKNIQVRLVILFLVFQVQIQAQSIVGKWHNDHSSVLSIDSISIEGQIYGQYLSSTGVNDTAFPLTGWINKTAANDTLCALNFSVNWGEYGSITSWTGYYEKKEDVEQLYMMWHLVRPNTDFSPVIFAS